MEQDKQRLYVVIVAVGVLAISVSACFGAFAGGIVGYFGGRKASDQIAEHYLRLFREWGDRQFEPEEPGPFPPERAPLVPMTGGALVTKVVGGSPADLAGIQPGDLILAVDRVRIEEENTLKRVIGGHQPGDEVEITLWSGIRERTVTVRLGEHPEEKKAAYLGVYYEMLSRGTERPGSD